VRIVSVLASALTICISLIGGTVGAGTLPAVFSFGSNSFGKTGQNTSAGSTPLATPIIGTNLGSERITQVSAGGFHTSLLLADDGTVFSCGRNDAGETGQNTLIGNTLVAMPIDTSNLAGKKIIQIAAGGAHSLLLSEDGIVFSFGSNSLGETGLDITSGYTSVATPIDATNLGGRKIAQIAAGGTHSLLLADDGTVFSFGSNSDGETGLNTSIGFTPIATPIVGTGLVGKTITQVAAGGDHSLLLADDGTVFSFGGNGFGQTGLNTTIGNTPIATSIDATNLAGKKISQIAAGRFHSLLLTDDGTVFSFGSNGNGRTGLNTSSGNTARATPIVATKLAGKAISQVAAGEGHSLLLASDGTVFSFGAGGQGQTGLNTTTGNTLIATPIVQNNLVGPYSRVVSIAAGYEHSIVIAVPEPTTTSLALLSALPFLFLQRSRRLPATTALAP
jgi:alpha-tubulin suppressor-like RCC1 family protein